MVRLAGTTGQDPVRRMPTFEADRKALIGFVDTFAKGVDDLVLRVSSGTIIAAVGQLTHYLRKGMPCTSDDEGHIYVSDVARLLAFLKSVTSADVTVNQRGRGRPLHVKGGNSNLELPTSTYIASDSDVSLIEKIVKKSEESMWTSFGNAPLPAEAVVDGADLYPLAKATKVIGNLFTCKAELRPKDSDFTVMASKSSKGKMFVNAEAEQVSGDKESYVSHFAHWLPDLLGTVPNQNVSIHMGENAPLVIRGRNDDFLLIVFDQEVDE